MKNRFAMIVLSFLAFHSCGDDKFVGATDFSALAGGEKITLTWKAGPSNTTGYMIARSINEFVFLPKDGSTYKLNQTVGTNVTIAYVGNDLQTIDKLLNANVLYHYKLYSYTISHTYSVGLDASATPTKAWSPSAYFKSANSDPNDAFGSIVSLDGNTMIVCT